MSRRFRHLALILLSATFLLPVRSTAGSGFRPRIAVQPVMPGNKSFAILVNGQPFAIIRTASSGQSPLVRAQAIADRLQTLVTGGLAPGAVDAHHAGDGAWLVRAGQVPLILVTPQESAEHAMNAEELSRSWATHLRLLLAEPPVTADAAVLIVPVGDTRTTPIRGAALAAEIRSADQDDAIAQSHYDPGSRRITVQGIRPGRTAILVSADGTTVTLAVRVMNYAAQITAAITVNVTGDPGAPCGLLRKAVYAGLERAVLPQPDASVAAAAQLSTLPQSLAPGAQVTMSVPVHTGGKNLLPRDADVSVTIVNEPVPARRAEQLFYSNSPETVRRKCVLFEHALVTNRAVRLDYHHVNGSGSPFVFHVDLVNDTGQSAAVQVISGTSLPGEDTVMVGLRAGSAFLDALDSNAGIVRRIAPHSRAPLVVQRVDNGLTVSGIVQLCQIEGASGAVHVRVHTDEDDTALTSPLGRVLAALPAATMDSAPWPDQPATDSVAAPIDTPKDAVFGPPTVRTSASYLVGGKWAFVSLGRLYSGYANQSDGNWDNYGADYHVTITIANHETKPAAVGLFFAPEAGSAAGVFRVDGGPIVEFPPTPPSAERLIAKFALDSGETRSVLVHSIPLNGSYYPVSLIVHAY